MSFAARFVFLILITAEAIQNLCEHSKFTAER